MRLSLVATAVFAVVSCGGAMRASDIYVAQNAAGANNGTACANAYAISWANSSSNWGSGSGKIGPGTTVHLCGTFTSSARGGNVLTVQGNGSAGDPVTILFESGAQMNSTGWWGSYNADDCPSCTGAITVNDHSYITIDGGTNGVIQNTLSGTPGNHCAGGTCSQSPGGSGSLGIHLNGDYLTVKNLTIQGIYMNAGNNSGASDRGGVATADIRVDGPATNIQIYNNHLSSARAGIWGAFNGATGPSGCPGSGVCIYHNTVSDHAWQMTLNSAGSNNIVNVYGNTITDWTNWQYPTSLYHQDGLFIWGSSNDQKVTAYVWNNYIYGDLGAGSPSGMIYCANNGISGAGTGCALTAFNNLIVLTGFGGSGSSGDQAFAFKFDVSGANMGPIHLYNNTVSGGRYGIEIYTGGTAGATWTLENNIFSMGSGGYYINQSNSGSPIGSLSAKGNVYYGGNARAWGMNGPEYATITAWQSACNCDQSSLVANPNLGDNYAPTSASAGISLGVDLTSLGLGPLDSDMAGKPRPGALNGPPTGNWSAGAYEYFGPTSGPTPPASPTGLTAQVN